MNEYTVEWLSDGWCVVTGDQKMGYQKVAGPWDFYSIAADFAEALNDAAKRRG